MDKLSLADRRNFLKIAGAGVAGLPFIRLNEASAAPAAWTSKKPINPDIDNMKVICCHDTAMVKAGAVMTNFTSQNNAVNAEKIYSNLDEMACRLAAKTTPDLAWRTIFRSSKAWADTRVAIKVNCVNTNCMPRIAIIAKLCKVLNGFGVQGKNIVIYDGCTNALGPYTPYCSLTDASKVNAVVSNLSGALGGTTAVIIEGWTQKQFVCTADLALGKVDILINCAVNKGHDRSYSGYFTLCMKNHYGTFGPPVDLHDSTVPFININKHDAIIGGIPVRQQLCIIDSLTGSINHNPATAPDVPPPYRLIMGTFAPAVDYLCATKIREPIMNAVHDTTVVNTLLSYFGYTAADTQWQEYIPGQSSVRSPQRNASQRSLTVVLSSKSFKASPVRFNIRNERVMPIDIAIFNVKGSLVKNHAVDGSLGTVVWDGKTNAGNRISTGTYVVKAVSGNWAGAETMLIYQ